MFDGNVVAEYNGDMATHRSAVVVKKEGKWFVARSVELGVVSQGKTIGEAKKNLKEALELYRRQEDRILADVRESRRELKEGKGKVLRSLKDLR